VCDSVVNSAGSEYGAVASVNVILGHIKVEHFWTKKSTVTFSQVF